MFSTSNQEFPCFWPANRTILLWPLRFQLFITASTLYSSTLIMHTGTPFITITFSSISNEKYLCLLVAGCRPDGPPAPTEVSAFPHCPLPLCLLSMPLLLLPTFKKLSVRKLFSDIVSHLALHLVISHCPTSRQTICYVNRPQNLWFPSNQSSLQLVHMEVQKNIDKENSTSTSKYRQI